MLTGTSSQMVIGSVFSAVLNIRHVMQMKMYIFRTAEDIVSITGTDERELQNSSCHQMNIIIVRNTR